MAKLDVSASFVQSDESTGRFGYLLLSVSDSAGLPYTLALPDTLSLGPVSMFVAISQEFAAWPLPTLFTNKKKIFAPGVYAFEFKMDSDNAPLNGDYFDIVKPLAIVVYVKDKYNHGQCIAYSCPDLLKAKSGYRLFDNIDAPQTVRAKKPTRLQTPP